MDRAAKFHQSSPIKLDINVTAPPSIPGTSSKGFLLLSLGFAATVTGLFGVGTEYVREQYEAQSQRCLLAAQAVLDETPNPDLSVVSRRQTSSVASARLNSCLKD